VEEEVMLLDSEGSLAESSDAVLDRLSGTLAKRTTPETHAAVVEVKTGVHARVADAAAELESLRGELTLQLNRIDIHPAGAGTYPLDSPAQSRVSTAQRYSVVTESMRSLARREPTMALHVHIGIPDPDDAVRVLGALRRNLPVLLALSANSPFSHGQDSGFASLRTAIFQGFPRTGPPRHFVDYADYVAAIEVLISSGALPDPSWLWWDVRLQPALGTVEVRVMDAQFGVGYSTPLIALVQSLARLELEGKPPVREVAPEVLAENRFLAARDGSDACLIDPRHGRLSPLANVVDELVRCCRPHASALGCSLELDQVPRLAAANGADCQRATAAEQPDLTALVASLVARFVSPRPVATGAAPARFLTNRPANASSDHAALDPPYPLD
jgi:carboxylate-amine ligase